MLLLTNTTHILEITTSTSESIDYTVSYVDITSSSYTPGSNQGNIASATTTTIVSAPGASTHRQIKEITIINNGSSTNNITIIKDVSATDYKIFPTVTLDAGESLVYNGDGWKYFAADGTEQTSRLAAGNTTEVQINSGGTLAGSNMTYDSNTLTLGGTDAGLQLTNITSEPSTPSAGILRVYSKNICGRTMPKWKGPSGLDTPFQPAIFQKNVTFWLPGATSGTWTGTVQTAIAAGVAVTPTTTNLYTTLRRSTFTVATGANLQNSLRSDAMFFRGASAGQGGFFVFFRFGLNTWTANNRLFIGMTTGTTAVTTGNPSALTNIAGFGVDQGDTAITFMHNDGSGTAVKETISGTTLATNQGYDAWIFCKPNDSTIYYRLDDLLTGNTLVDTSVSSELPTNTTMLNAHAAIGSGSNTGAAAAVLGLNRIYTETDY